MQCDFLHRQYGKNMHGDVFIRRRKIIELTIDVENDVDKDHADVDDDDDDDVDHDDDDDDDDHGLSWS